MIVQQVHPLQSLFSILSFDFPILVPSQLSHLVVDLLNWTLDRGKALEKLKGIAIEACRRAEMAKDIAK